MKIRIPAAYLGPTFQLVRGFGGAPAGQGTPGNVGLPSGLVTNGITWAAYGGNGGATASSPTGGTGGTTQIPGEGRVVEVLAKEDGASGGNGSTSQAAGSPGGNSNLAGAGGAGRPD